MYSTTYCVIRYRLCALFPQFKEERNQPANCTYFYIWLFVYTHGTYIVDSTHTNNDFCRFVWFWLFAHWRLFILFSSQLLLFSRLFFVRLFYSLLYCHVYNISLIEDGLHIHIVRQVEQKIASTIKWKEVLTWAFASWIFIWLVRAWNRFACTDAFNKIASIIIIITTKQ